MTCREIAAAAKYNAVDAFTGICIILVNNNASMIFYCSLILYFIYSIYIKFNPRTGWITGWLYTKKYRKEK